MISESKTIFFKVKWHCGKWEKGWNEISFPSIYIFSEGANFAGDFDRSSPFTWNGFRNWHKWGSFKQAGKCEFFLSSFPSRNVPCSWATLILRSRSNEALVNTECIVKIAGSDHGYRICLCIFIYILTSSLSNKYFKLVLHQDSMSCTLKVEGRGSTFSDMMYVWKIDTVVCW